MWLVLCSDDDVAAQWARAGLCQRHSHPVELVTASSLAYANRWIHHVDDDGSGVEVTLPDGRVIDSRQLDGVLNRVVGIWNSSTAQAVSSDRDYAVQEYYAFSVSWLACLPGPVINRPTFAGPGGRWRHNSEWMLLAARAGLPTRPYRMPGPPPSDPVHPTHVVVLGHDVFGLPEASPLADGCRRLAELSDTELLGVDLDPEAGGFSFVAATPRPDLRVGGAALLDAIADRFARTESTVR